MVPHDVGDNVFIDLTQTEDFRRIDQIEAVFVMAARRNEGANIVQEGRISSRSRSREPRPWSSCSES